MRWIGTLVIVTVGCGRFGFDPVDPVPVIDTTSPWDEIGGSATGLGITGVAPGAGLIASRLALSTDERPIVSWVDSANGNDEIRLKAWLGTAWSGLDGSDVGGGISNDPASSLIGGLAVGPDDQICHAWVANETNEMSLRCWSGAGWYGLANSDNGISSPGNPWWPQVRFVGNDPVIAWEDYGGGAAGLYARRFDGTTWKWLGPSALPGIAGQGQHAALSRPAPGEQQLWLACSDTEVSDIRVSRWDGSSWSAALPGGGLVAATPAPSQFPSIEVGELTYVLWVEGASGATAVYLRAWDGTAWTELGGSASGDGISAGQVPAESATLALTPDGQPVVAYRANGDIHVVSWDGAAWVRLGEQGDDGVSRSGAAQHVSLAIAPSGAIFVAWNEDLADGKQLYLRRLTPRSP